MKRYRVLPGIWDGRPLLLAQQSNGKIAPQADTLLKQNIVRIRAEVLAQYGATDFNQKLERFRDSGYLNASIVTEHNRLLLSARDSYISGYFYPTLVSACALGERILNDLVLKMRPHFAGCTKKDIQKKEAFTNWETMVDVLREWQIFGDETCKQFINLKHLRSFSVHYDPDLFSSLETRAKNALTLISEIIHAVFPAMLPERYAIREIKGESFIKKAAEKDPFIHEYYLPNCIYVGPRHRITDLRKYPWGFEDEVYPEKEITDEEFAQMIDGRNTAIKTPDK